MSMTIPCGRHGHRTCCLSSLAIAAALVPSSAALAAGEIDLELAAVRVTQAIKFTNTPLIAGNATMVRAIIEHPDVPAQVPDVDALLRVFVDGVEADFSPVRSINGPIVSPTSPNELTIGNHVNFLFIAPDSSDVDLRVIVNPGLLVPEVNLDNNAADVLDLDFECRGTVELVYVPIDYVPSGGVPDDELIEPGIGDGFLRAVFHPREWDYHRSPLPPLVWTQDINSSSTSLLSTLRDIRVNQLPAAGYSRPALIYGWLPGNPYSGNGRAIGIPGDAAFGNTELIRHQRTFAHEIGHLLNEPHNSETVNTIGIDVEHHLKHTQNIAQTHAPSKLDVMAPGQLTPSAFVSNNTYVQVHGDSRFGCALLAEGEPTEVLRISGVYDHVTNTLALDPLSYIERGVADPPRADGNMLIILRDARGNEIGRTIADVGSTRELCSDPADGIRLADDSPLHVLVPLRVDGSLVRQIDVARAATGDVVATAAASANAPAVNFTQVARIIGAQPVRFDDLVEGARLTDTVRFEWIGADADGETLTYTLLYSRDGGDSWLPLAVNLKTSSFQFSVNDIPASRGPNGLLRLIASDGFNHRVITSPPMEFAGGSPPELYLMTPNPGTYSRYANVIFRGTAWDKEDQRIADDIVWSSDLDGVFGTGALIEFSGLSVGRHSITATVTDTDGATDSKSVRVDIDERLFADFDNDGLVAFSDLLDLLAAWGPCESEFCPWDLDYDGIVSFADLLQLLSNWS